MGGGAECMYGRMDEMKDETDERQTDVRTMTKRKRKLILGRVGGFRWHLWVERVVYLSPGP